MLVLLARFSRREKTEILRTRVHAFVHGGVARSWSQYWAQNTKGTFIIFWRFAHTDCTDVRVSSHINPNPHIAHWQ